MTLNLRAGFVLLLFASGQPVFAQSTAPPAGPAFDVAAIHVHIPEPHEHNSIWSNPADGHFKSANVSLKSLIHWAWQIPEARILGGPSWLDSSHFDILASSDSALDAQLRALPVDAAQEQKRAMVRKLLVDRFSLSTHAEAREAPVYWLVAAKDGPRLGALQEGGTTINTGNGHIQVQGNVSTELLAEELSKVVGRSVIDKTGITGRYNLDLRWSPDADGSTRMLNGQLVTGTPGEQGPSIFTALQEQLGLKLESQKGTVEVLIVDRAQMPAEN